MMRLQYREGRKQAFPTLKEEGNTMEQDRTCTTCTSRDPEQCNHCNQNNPAAKRDLYQSDDEE